jgi:transposase-like protein
MPWKECSVVEERLRFVARLLDGEAMTELCREFGISRKPATLRVPLQAAETRASGLGSGTRLSQELWRRGFSQCEHEPCGGWSAT